MVTMIKQRQTLCGKYSIPYKKIAPLSENMPKLTLSFVHSQF